MCGVSQIRKLKMQLEDERQKHLKMENAFTEGERMENGTDLHVIEMQSKSHSCPNLKKSSQHRGIHVTT